MEITPAYRLLLSDAIPEIGGKGTLLRHVKSGAHLFLIETEDTNKVFSIAFRTTPEDDTGAAHIMEHSVLCGSEKYPLKDPFMELAKGSMNTFLNAMTYPDKTLYPVASVNDRDFRNLMDVYLDAVFHPNIYREEKIFRQEGWHYELTDPEGPLTYNGVVYNEMRGAFSNPETVLERKLLHALFPHNCYANESGGDPGAIPDLTYEAFCAFHRRYYHPSNAYIYLYGKMDMGERLAYLDREYLSHYDAIDPGTEIPDEPPFCGMVREEGVYASEGEPAGVMLAYAKVVNGGLDPVESMAFDALSYALINAPGAPLTQALLDAGLAEDVYGGYDSGLKQPVFRVIAKGAKEGDEEAFEALIERVLAEQAEQGVSEESLRAGIHNNEFSLREADYGRMPKGLIYGLGVYDTWLNDEYAPMLNLKFEAPLAEVKARVGTGYFEALIREKLLLNPHGAMVSVRPEEGLAEREDRRTAEKLEAVRAAMTPEERARLVRETEALKAYQAEPSPKEDLEKIPLLSIGDLEPGTRPFVNRETALAGLKTFWHPAVTSGILYLDMYFGIDHVEAADFPYLTVLKNVLSLIGTEHYTYQALANAISLRTGGIGCSVEMFAVTDSDALREDFVIRAKCLYGETADMADLVAEIAFRTDFSDTKRLKELLSELRLDMKDSIVESGHATAVARVLARCTKDAYENECLKGIEFYRFLTDLLDHYEERKDALVSKLRALYGEIFRKGKTVLSVTCEEPALETLGEALEPLAALIPDGCPAPAARPFTPVQENEAFRTASQVQYVAAGGNFAAHGYAYTGAMQVLRSYLSTEYLWVRLRVQGGAYGCMSMFYRNGGMAFASYRDPNLQQTLEVYRALPDHLETLSLDRRDMTKYIIGTVSDLDTPLQPHAEGERSFAAYRRHVTEDMVNQERAQILSCAVEDLRALAPAVRAALSDGLCAVVGSASKIAAEPEGFGLVTAPGGAQDEE